MKKGKTGILLGALALLAVMGYSLANRSSAAPAEPFAVRPGHTAGDFSIKLFSGGKFTLSEQRGKVTVVNFWASWCAPCREEAPLLEQAWQKYKDQGVILAGVNVWDKDQDARSFIERYGLTFANGPDSAETIAVDYGVTGLPETWFIKGDGKLARRWIGALSGRQVSTFIEEALR
ncbi:MAG: TlpA disulfide reductase family protein [Dehalococcoidia bacterium]|nr:TlpA disulfide reductase family protein [Dehalococcoidia bacterium]